MSTTAASPLPDGSALRQRLSALRQRLWLIAAWRGAAWLTAIVLGALVVFGLVDYRLTLWDPRFSLPPLVRALVLVGALVSSALVAWYQLLLPLSEPMD